MLDQFKMEDHISVIKPPPTLKRQKPGVYHTYLNMHSCSLTCKNRSQLSAICISMHTLICAASVYLYTHLDVIPYDIACMETRELTADEAAKFDEE